MTNESMDVLLVEDNEDDSTFFVHALKAAVPTAQIRVARDGVEALAMIFGAECPENVPLLARPKLVILDLKMPKISGLEVLRRLKGNAHSRTIPVVVLSSSLEKRDLADIYQLGANSYLVKPMDFDEFGETVKMLGHYWLQFNQPPKP
jgi:two-component system response regulator